MDGIKVKLSKVSKAYLERQGIINQGYMRLTGHCPFGRMLLMAMGGSYQSIHSLDTLTETVQAVCERSRFERNDYNTSLNVFAAFNRSIEDHIELCIHLYISHRKDKLAAIAEIVTYMGLDEYINQENILRNFYRNMQKVVVPNLHKIAQKSIKTA